MNARAFTLIELLIVTAIIMFLCTLGIPTLIDRNDYFLQQELEKIEVVIRSLQHVAMVTQKTQLVTLEPATNTYFFVKNAKKVHFSLNSNFIFGYRPALGPPANPTAQITQSITFPQKNGVFYIKILSNGKISPGAIYIVDKQQITMGALTCSVSQVSYIRRYLYKTNQWQLLTT